jgi:hypothetical protein
LEEGGRKAKRKNFQTFFESLFAFFLLTFQLNAVENVGGEYKNLLKIDISLSENSLAQQKPCIGNFKFACFLIQARNFSHQPRNIFRKSLSRILQFTAILKANRYRLSFGCDFFGMATFSLLRSWMGREESCRTFRKLNYFSKNIPKNLWRIEP